MDTKSMQILSVEDSLVRIYQSQKATEKDSMENDQDYGLNTSDSSTKLDRIMLLPKMWQTCAVADLAPSCTISGRSGMMQNGILFQLHPLVPYTKESVVGSWRTPDANMGKRGPKSLPAYIDSLQNGTHAVNLNDQVRHRLGLMKVPPMFAEWLMMFPSKWTG